MKKLILSLSLIIFFVLFQADLLTAEAGKEEHSRKKKENSQDEHNHNDDGKAHEEKSKDHEKEEHAHAEEETEEHKGESHQEHNEHDNHGDHDEKDEPGGHEEEEGSSAVGPDKGILEKSENGFKLSPEAIQAFELKMQNASNNRLEFPRVTLVEIKDDKFVYRIRDSWIKKVSVKVIKKNKDTVILELSQFQKGDKIIVGGTGFVRVSELVAEEGVSHGHSH